MVARQLKLIYLTFFIFFKMMIVNAGITIVIDAFNLLSLEGVDRLQFLFCVAVAYFAFFGMFIYDASLRFREYISKKAIDMQVESK